MKSIKLNKLEEQNLNEKQMNVVKGGLCTCGCGCMYSDSGGSSVASNANANKARGLFSAQCVKEYCDGEWFDVRDTDPIYD